MIYRRKLSDIVSKIHALFGLKEQGKELVAFVNKSIGCKHSCLLFLDVDGEDFTTRFCEPESKDNPLFCLRLNRQNPIVEYLEREQKVLTRESSTTLPELHNLWNAGEITTKEIELLVPLVSRDRLIGILALGDKQSGRYSLEDFSLLDNITHRVAVSMEKEYLREQLSEHEEELSASNRCSAIIASSLEIREIFDSFVEELKKVVDISWASIVLTEDDALYLLASYSEGDNTGKVGERWSIKGTATEWVVTHKKTVVEPDLSQESRFITPKSCIEQGLCSIAYLPLIAKGRAIGCLIVASRQPHAYNKKHTMFLERLASQIAMPIENSRVYAEVEEKARIDELTGLLNRRSLNEVISSEINRHSRCGSVFSLIILDLDSFKAFNDSHGHLAGDKLLREIGSIVKSAIRSSDQAFRYGGDEFAILLPDTPIDATNQVAERVRKQVASKMMDGYTPVTTSLGLASWPADGIGANEVIAAADAALYYAKRSGGNRSHCTSSVAQH